MRKTKNQKLESVEVDEGSELKLVSTENGVTIFYSIDTECYYALSRGINPFSGMQTFELQKLVAN